ncbi:hypothetical protein EsH8_IV_000157 [Colletotrichum jinshuiense]
MKPQSQIIPVAQPSGVQYFFGTGDGAHSFTWSPPGSSVSFNQEEICSGGDLKRRRVHVDVVKHGVALLQLGSDMTMDFRSTHAEAERKLENVISERDRLLSQLHEAKNYQEKATNETQQLKSDLSDTTKLYKDMALELSSAVSRRDQLQLELEESQRELTATRADLTVRQEVLGVEPYSAAKAIEELEKQLNASHKEREKMKSDMEALRNRTEAYREEAAANQKTLRDSNNARYAEITILNRQARQSHSERAAAQADLETLLKRLKAAEQRDEASQRDLREFRTNRGGHEIALNEYYTLRSRLAMAKKKQEKAEADIQKLQDEKNSLQSIIEFEEKRLGELEASLEKEYGRTWNTDNEGAPAWFPQFVVFFNEVKMMRGIHSEKYGSS